jgi:acyl carrier protein
MLTEPESSRPATSSAEQATILLIKVVRDLVHEFHPQPTRSLEVRLEDSLDQDLGLDSLSRAELLARLDRAFRVRLPEELLSEAETPGDLLHAIMAASTGVELAPSEERSPVVATVAERPPAEADTLPAVLAWHLAHCPDRAHIILDSGDQEQVITYRQFAESARARG